MSKKILEVTRVSDGKVSLKYDREKMCSCCSLTSLCGQGTGDLIVNSQGINFKPGDKAEVEISSSKILSGGLIVFLLPAIIFLATLIGTRYVVLLDNEMLSFSLALGAVCVYYMVVKLFLKKWFSSFEFKIIRKCEE